MQNNELLSMSSSQREEGNATCDPSIEGELPNSHFDKEAADPGDLTSVFIELDHDQTTLTPTTLVPRAG